MSYMLACRLSLHRKDSDSNLSLSNIPDPTAADGILQVYVPQGAQVGSSEACPSFQAVSSVDVSFPLLLLGQL